MILHRLSPNQPKNITHTNFQVNPSIIRVHRRMQAEIQVFEPLTSASMVSIGPSFNQPMTTGKNGLLSVVFRCITPLFRNKCYIWGGSEAL